MAVTGSSPGEVVVVDLDLIVMIWTIGIWEDTVGIITTVVEALGSTKESSPRPLIHLRGREKCLLP